MKGVAASVIRSVFTCYHFSISGDGLEGCLGQLGDGQIRLDSSLQSSTFCINDQGQMIDQNHFGCIVTDTNQFQCDHNSPYMTPGFSLTGQGQLQFNGSPDFWACPATDTTYNIYTEWLPGQEKCSMVEIMHDDSCGPDGTSLPPPPNTSPGSGGPKPSSPAQSPPGGSPGSPPSGPSPSPSAPSVPGGCSGGSGGPGGSSGCTCPGGSGTCQQGGSPGGSQGCSPGGSPGCSQGGPQGCSQGGSPGGSPGCSQGGSQGGPQGGSQGGPQGCSQGGSQGGPQGCSQGGSGGSSGGNPGSGSGSCSGGSGQGSPGSNGSGCQGSPAASPSRPVVPKPSSPTSGGQSPPGSGAPPSSYPLTPSGTQPGKACQTELTGSYETPHLIVPVCNNQPDYAFGTKFFGNVNETTNTIFNFDIPESYAGKTCALIFLFPLKSDLETSDYDFVDNGGSLNFYGLSSGADQETTWNNKPPVQKPLGSVQLKPGGSYYIADGPCVPGERISVEMALTGGSSLYYFQDWNPSPIGCYITAC